MALTVKAARDHMYQWLNLAVIKKTGQDSEYMYFTAKHYIKEDRKELRVSLKLTEDCYLIDERPLGTVEGGWECVESIYM